MTSRPVLQSVGYNLHVDALTSPFPPPPPLRDAPQGSPLNRENAVNPPLLTTSVPSVQPGSYNSTPRSAVSRQSPFSPLYPLSAGLPTSTTTVASPMASRLSGHFNVPYDPRDWAPGTDRRANQVLRARENATEDGIASPPPPYSPANANQQEGRPQRPSVQPTPSMPNPQVPLSASAAQPQRVFPPVQSPPHNRHSIHMGYKPPPPPPPPTSSAGPGVALPRARVVSDMQAGYNSREGSPAPALQPPSARRAASANADVSYTPEAGPSRSSSQQRNWHPGMPLPGPPPGPPPSGSRSQSTSATLDRQITSGSRPRPLRQTMQMNELGPIPPTPADWTDSQPMPNNSNNGLHIDTVNVPHGAQRVANSGPSRYGSANYSTASNSAQPQSEPTPANVGTSGNLSRSSAVRDSSAKGIRERRAQNRNSGIFNPDFSALSVQTNPWADAIEQTDGSGSRQEPPGSARSVRTRPKALSPLAGLVANHDQISASPIQMSNTPPVSPRPVQQIPDGPKSAQLPPKALPTPPLSHTAPQSAHSTLPPPRDTLSGPVDELDAFQREAHHRHIQFLQKEKLAKTDADRLQLFAEYITSEAWLRRRKYETAFLAGDFDVDSLRQNLFRRAADRNSAAVSVEQEERREPASSENVTPQRGESMWWKEYQPALSPIASMDYDEMSSRGRAPSRWWESQTGSQSGGNGNRGVQRSKRESKYMGLSKEFLMTHSPSEELPNLFGNRNTIIQDPTSYPKEKVNPEEFGYYDDDAPRPVSVIQTKQPESPSLLDISRFITLPPPFPRHYPAVNNNHPNLAQYRTTVRTLSDLSEVKTRKSRHQASLDALQNEHKRKLSENRRIFRSNVQAQIQEGSITFAEAAEAEEAFQQSEFEAEKQSVQAEFDTLQDVVINPLHDMLHERITQLNNNIQHLQDDLHTDARYQDPDRPQEEGDETPELLEKLTQLKWLFDLREQIQRECFELLSERNDKYKAIVLLPYQYGKQTEKVRDTEAFFERDAKSRYLAYCNDSLKRHENFFEVIDQHVGRGVELQSSAFWDIAPGLVDLLQKIPEDLRNFEGILIPDKEYTENPSFHQYPQQYLYLLLSHAEKSTYQFIEGQVNLQCLLHEVKTSLLSTRYRALEVGESREGVTNSHLSDSKAREEAMLTAELKQKASMIEEQWLEALGSQLQGTRDRVKALLQEDDAWDEVASEDA